MKLDPRMEELEQTIAAAMATLGSMARTMQQAPDATIRPQLHARDAERRQALERFRTLMGRESLAGGRVVVGETLGAGGMGIVRLGRQRSVDREVAVKTLRPEMADEPSALRLLQEGWITAWLEHPNIVPVHDIEIDEAGQPVVVLKRIEGLAWSELLADRARVRELFGAEDLLEWNLRILVQVCNAVHFAHSRGILHRDLKPENVMVGSFGEVYLLDWGIAVSLREEDAGRIPLAREARAVAGTPCYMAPELLGGAEPTLSERTDVYLLCAILHELLVGEPPHRGQDLGDLLRRMLQPVELMEGPQELRELCEQGLRPQMQERPESAEEVKARILDYLTHRGSRSLANRAEQRLTELLARLDADPRAGAGPAAKRHGAGVAAEEGSLRLRLYELHSQCRFGFHEALSSWPENQAAAAGLLRATEALARYELRAGDPRAARNLLAGLSAADPGLVEEIEQAEARWLEEQRRIQRLAGTLDQRRGGRTRMWLAALIGLVWAAVPILARLTVPVERASHEHNLALVLLLIGVAIAFGFGARRAIARSLYNRRFFGNVFAVSLMQLPFSLVAWSFDLSVQNTQILLMSLHAFCAILVTTNLEPRGWPSAVAYSAAFIGAAIWPEWIFAFASAPSVVLTINVLAIWRERPAPVPIRSPSIG